MHEATKIFTLFAFCRDVAVNAAYIGDHFRPGFHLCKSIISAGPVQVDVFIVVPNGEVHHHPAF